MTGPVARPHADAVLLAETASVKRFVVYTAIRGCETPSTEDNTVDFGNSSGVPERFLVAPTTGSATNLGKRSVTVS